MPSCLNSTVEQPLARRPSARIARILVFMDRDCTPLRKRTQRQSFHRQKVHENRDLERMNGHPGAPSGYLYTSGSLGTRSNCLCEQRWSFRSPRSLGEPPSAPCAGHKMLWLVSSLRLDVGRVDTPQVRARNGE